MASKSVNMTVGLFVGLGSVLLFVVIILLGQENSLFESNTTLYVTFEDVGGLRPGSQVRLAGVTIGTVTSIDFPSELADKKLHVQMQVQQDMMRRIRKDSIATITTKGLLGDKVIEITIGSQDAEELKGGDYLQSKEPTDMFQILEKGQELVSHGADVARELKIAIKKYSDDELVNHIKGIAQSLDAIIDEVENGDGVVHSVIYDKQVNTDVKVIVSNVRTATNSLKKAIDHIENIMNEVRTGQGTLHGLIYDEDGKKIVQSLRSASETIAQLVSEIESGDGMLHTLIYTEDSGNIIANLEKASADIRKIAAYIESGHGTIGGLIKDPTVFEDLKLIVGNLRRNKALKTLIRLSLEKADTSAAPAPDPEAGDQGGDTGGGEIPASMPADTAQ